MTNDFLTTSSTCKVGCSLMSMTKLSPAAPVNSEPSWAQFWSHFLLCGKLGLIVYISVVVRIDWDKSCQGELD